MTDTLQEGRDPTETVRPGRPLPIKLMMWVFALWTLLGWLRFGRALGEGDLIIRLLSPGLYGYLLLAGLAWGLLGVPVLWGLMRRARWAPLLLKIAAIFYPLSNWIERWLLWQDPDAHRNWPFMLLLTIGWFGLVIWGLRAARSRDYFTDEHKKG